MHECIARHRDHIVGVLSGFDRLVFRGTLRSIADVDGMKRYLWANQVLLKDFGTPVDRVSQALKEASVAEATRLGRPVQDLRSSDLDQEAIARRLAADGRITEGLICVLTCVEPCWSFEISRNRDPQKRELQPRQRKCLFLYPYSIPPAGGSCTREFRAGSPSRFRSA